MGQITKVNYFSFMKGHDPILELILIWPVPLNQKHIFKSSLLQHNK